MGVGVAVGDGRPQAVGIDFGFHLVVGDYLVKSGGFYGVGCSFFLNRGLCGGELGCSAQYHSFLCGRDAVFIVAGRVAYRCLDCKFGRCGGEGLAQDYAFGPPAQVGAKQFVKFGVNRFVGLEVAVELHAVELVPLY